MMQEKHGLSSYVREREKRIAHFESRKKEKKRKNRDRIFDRTKKNYARIFKDVY
jgi:hypothetical protein